MFRPKFSETLCALRRFKGCGSVHYAAMITSNYGSFGGVLWQAVLLPPFCFMRRFVTQSVWGVVDVRSEKGRFREPGSSS